MQTTQQTSNNRQSNFLSLTDALQFNVKVVDIEKEN
jgi:hypothetical protein